MSKVVQEGRVDSPVWYRFIFMKIVK